MRPVIDREFSIVKNSQCYRMFSLNLCVRIYMLLAGCHKGNVLESKVLLVRCIYEIWVEARHAKKRVFSPTLMPCQAMSGNRNCCANFQIWFSQSRHIKGCGLWPNFQIWFLIYALARHIKGCKVWPSFSNLVLIVSLLPKEGFLGLCKWEIVACVMLTHTRKPC